MEAAGPGGTSWRDGVGVIGVSPNTAPTSPPAAEKGDLSPLVFQCHARLMCVTSLSPGHTWDRLCISPTVREGLGGRNGQVRCPFLGLQAKVTHLLMLQTGGVP